VVKWIVTVLATTAVFGHGFAQQQRIDKDRSRTELVLVYFGGSNCGPCKAPELKASIRDAKVLLAQQAEERGLEFSSIGVAVDTSIQEGVHFLEDVGPFDQIIVGKGFLNLAALTFLAIDSQSQLAIPQVVVYEQRIGIDHQHIAVSEPRILNAIVGGAITLWVRSGAPLYR